MLLFFLSFFFLGSAAQLRSWPPPQNPAQFFGGFSTIFFLQGRVVSSTPNPHPGGPGLCIYIPQRQGRSSVPYDYITKICRKRPEVIQNYDNVNVQNIRKSEAQHRKCKRLRLGGGQAYDRPRV
jgi:hypothetical protein